MRPATVLLLAALAACGEGTFQPTFTQARLQAPSIYRTWYENVAGCAGSERPYERIRWYRDSKAWVEMGDGTLSWAAYWPSRSIVLTERVLEDRGTVTHEMLHYALYPIGGHPKPYFGTCAPAGTRFTNHSADEEGI